MKERTGYKRKEWQKPTYESLKFSKTFGGTKRGFFESSTLGNGKFHGTIS